MISAKKPHAGPGWMSFACLLAAAASPLALSACGKEKQGGPPGAGAQQTPEVGYVTVQKSSVPIVTELGGRTEAYATAEVRPQVSGIIRKRYFKQGSIVHKGQPLYQIDPRTYRAAANEARANLASAQANAAAAKVRADRYRPLAEMEAISKQDYTDAQATERQAQASVQQSRAALESAQVNLSFTNVPAPITGRIGRTLSTEGALVTTNQADPLAVIQQLDPIYVDIQESSSELLHLRQSLRQGGAAPASAKVRLKLEDGSEYGYTGTVEFSEVTVDSATGTVTLRARFPNPDGLLLPGMFVRAQFAQAINTDAILVPQAALSRDPKGDATVLVIGPNNKVVQRQVETTRTDGTNWVVTKGLQPGDKIVTQGTSKVRPGQVVKPVPADTPQNLGNTKQNQKQAKKNPDGKTGG